MSGYHPTSDPKMIAKAQQMVADGFKLPSIMAATGLSIWVIRHSVKGASTGRPRGSTNAAKTRNKYRIPLGDE